MPPPPKLSGIAQKILVAYKDWHGLTRHIPKMLRYSLGVKIDILFSDIVELVSIARFSAKENQPPAIGKAIAKNDVLKFMLYVLLELQGIEVNSFVGLAEKIEEVGRMLYGWKMKLEKENHPTTK